MLTVKKKFYYLSSALLLIAALTLIFFKPEADADKGTFIPCSALNVPADMACIPGGPFLRGSNQTFIDEDSHRRVKDAYPEEAVSVSTFLMDKYEVTYQQYQDCVKAGKCRRAHTNYGGAYRLPDHPKMGISWYNAYHYCKAQGKRLSTEAEWEKAARGPKGDIYPWGNDPATCKKAIIKERGKRGCGTGVTWKVGSRPANRYGLYDMAGNSWEWVHDWYSPSYAKCGADCKGLDPKGPCKGAMKCGKLYKKIVRGGSWWWTGKYAAAYNRRPHHATNHPYHHFGFRCAKDPEN